MRDILMLQRELAQAVAAAVHSELRTDGGRELRPTPQINPRAYDSLLRSRAAAGKQSVEGFREAIAYAQDAVARQPDFAAAWSAMARYYSNGAFIGLLSPQECMGRSEIAVRKALELDAALPDAHITLGNVLYRSHWNWSAAEAEFRRALQLAPGDADAHRAFSVFLTMQGNSEAALVQAQQAIALDPLSLQALQDDGRALRAAGRYDEAIAAYRRALSADPNVPRAHFQLGRTYLLAGQMQQGVVELETAVNLSKRNPRYLAYLGHAYGRGGRPSDARRILNELTRNETYVSPVGLALVHTGLGDKKAALTSLDAAYRQRAFELVELREMSAFESLRAEPRFQELMARIGLPVRADRKP
ncbi:MAG TPA: tetratricopeptide repeat protein [Thermoanaerobaculia bacterium]|jgi:serine/threonine-protein kinase|nr:tetratricopeptide repeat protein [Thermoanaerobaculia bacterium]